MKRNAALRALIEAMAAVYPDGIFDDPAAWPRTRRLDVIALALVGTDGAVPERVQLPAANPVASCQRRKSRLRSARSSSASPVPPDTVRNGMVDGRNSGRWYTR